MPLAAPDYDELGRALAATDLAPSAAEAHGIYCGLLAAAVPEPRRRWLAELLPAPDGDAESARCRSLLNTLANATRDQLEGPALDFDLLLPAEGRSLRERAVAAHDWARGLLFGLGLAGIETERLSAPTRAAFDDLIEVTRMDLSDLADDEPNEQALTDVVEFIRVATMLLYEEAGAGGSAPRRTAPEPDAPAERGR